MIPKRAASNGKGLGRKPPRLQYSRSGALEAGS
jgi:hypothetical protein